MKGGRGGGREDGEEGRIVIVVDLIFIFLFIHFDKQVNKDFRADFMKVRSSFPHPTFMPLLYSHAKRLQSSSPSVLHSLPPLLP